MGTRVGCQSEFSINYAVVKVNLLGVLRLTEMPAVLVETEFLTHPQQLEFLTDPASQARMAAAIATGIDLLSGI